MDTDQNQANEAGNQEHEATTADTFEPVIDERSLLLQRARMMGLTVSNNIGLDKLKERIEDYMSNTVVDSVTAAVPLVDPTSKNTVVGKAPTLRQYLLNDALKLVRIRITNLDPKKKDLQGEIVTVANEHIGTVKKFVPYGEVTENGYHVPNCIYNMLRRRKFLNIRTRRGKNGQEHIEQTWAQEFSIEVLPPLTEEELKKLATAQTAAGSVN